MIPVLEVLYFLFQSIGEYPTATLIMGGTVGMAALIWGSVSLVSFSKIASEAADKTIAPINTVSTVALWSACGIVAAVALSLLFARFFGIEISFLRQMLLPATSLLFALVGTGAVCAGTYQSLRFKLRPKLFVSEQSEK